MFDILMAIKYLNMQFIGIKKQWNIRNQYLYTKHCAIIQVVMAINLIQEQVWSLKYHYFLPLAWNNDH